MLLSKCLWAVQWCFSYHPILGCSLHPILPTHSLICLLIMSFFFFLNLIFSLGICFFCQSDNCPIDGSTIDGTGMVLHPVLELKGWWGHTPVVVVLQYTFATSHVHLQQMSYVKICHDLHVQFLHGMIWNSSDESMPRSFFTIICFYCPDPFLCIQFVQWLDVFVNISKPPTIKTICDPSMLPLIKPIFPTSISIIDPLIPINHHFPVLPIHSHCFAHRKYRDHNLPMISPWTKYLNIQHIRISQCSHPHSSPETSLKFYSLSGPKINVSTAKITYPLVMTNSSPWYRWPQSK